MSKMERVLIPGYGWHVYGGTKAERKAAVLERRRTRGSRRMRRARGVLR